MKALYSAIAVAAGVIVVGGCGGPDVSNLPRTVEASGVVTLDGDPVEGASIVAASADSDYSAFGTSDSSGRFSLKSFEAKDGAVPGSYMVQVSKTVEVQAAAPTAEQMAANDAAQHAAEAEGGVSWKNDLPKKYASLTTSGITLQVPEDGTTELKLELVSQ